MKKLFILLIAFIFIIFPVKTYAATDFYIEEIEDIADDYSDNKFDLTFEGLLEFFENEMGKIIDEPIELFLKMLVIILISSSLKLLQNKQFDEVGQIIDKISIISMFLLLMPDILKIINIISDNLFDIKNFMTSFVPIFAGIVAASGEFLTSGLYTGIFLTGLIFISNFCINLVLPSFNLFLAVNLTSSIIKEISLKSLIEFYLKSIKWVLKGAVSVICFLLTLQTSITQSQDNLAVKIGEGVTGVIPVIGGALQDAVSSVYSSMEVVKSFAGSIGVGVIIWIFIPSFVLILIYYIAFNFLVIIADILNANAIESFLTGYKNLTELLLSLIILFLILLIFSTTVMINITGGV